MDIGRSKLASLRSDFHSRRPSRMLVLLGGAVVAGIAIVSALQIRFSFHRELQAAERHVHAVTAIVAEQTGRAIQSVDLILDTAARQLPEMALEAGDDEPHLNAWLKGLIAGVPQVDGLVLIDKHGKLRASSASAPLGPIDLSDRGYFRTLKEHPEGGLYIERPIASRTNGKWLVTLSRAIGGRDGFQGVMLASLDVGHFERVYRDLDLGSNGVVTLLRRDLVLLARFPRVEDAIGMSLADAPFYKTAFADGAISAMGRFASAPDNMPRIAAAQLVRGYPLAVSVMTSEAEALADWRDQTWFTLLGSLFGTLAIAVLVVRLARSLAERERDQAALRAAKEAAEASAADAEAATHRAETAARAKAQFLANMSHEIRTPMNGVLGMAGMLLGSKLSEDDRRSVEVIRESAHALLAIINDILDFSKLESGQLQLENSDFRLDQTVGSIVSLLNPRAVGKGLRLTVDIAAQVPRWLNADYGRLRQVLFNLVGNAIKFTDTGIVSVVVSDFPRDDGDIGLRFEIRDTGIGMTAEVQQGLFSRFVQGDSSISRRYGGTGLGLAISRQLVGLMGGEIGVDSAPNRGSCFWFTMRCRRATAPEPAVPPPSLAVSGATMPSLRVLVAEDNPVNQLVIAKILKAAGHYVDVVANGVEAVTAIEMANYDLVFMDVQMPEMDGIAATRRIRAMPGGNAQIPIIALTANAMPGDREVYLAAGMNEYVAKPIDQPVLFAAMARVVKTPLEPRGEAAVAAVETDQTGFVDLDESRLAELQPLMSDQEFSAMIAAFLDGTAERVRRIEAAAAANDLALLRREAHDLKSTAGTYGAQRLFALGERLEHSVRLGRSEPWQELAAQARTLGDVAMAAIGRRFLKKAA